jgi:hypothetical protein
MKFRHGVESPGVMLVAAGPGAVATVRIQFTDVTMVPDLRCGVNDIMRIAETWNYKYQHAGLVFINGSGQRSYLAYTGYTVNAPGDITFTGCNVLYALAYSHPVGTYAGVVNCSMLRAYDGAAWNPQHAMGGIPRIKNFDPDVCLFNLSGCATTAAPGGWPIWDGTIPRTYATAPGVPYMPLYGWVKDGWDTVKLQTCGKQLAQAWLVFWGNGAQAKAYPWQLFIIGYSSGPVYWWVGRKLDNNNDVAGIYTRGVYSGYYENGCSPTPATIELEVVAP